MDKEYWINVIFKIIAVIVLIFALYITIYQIVNPNYFYTMSSNSEYINCYLKNSSNNIIGFDKTTYSFCDYNSSIKYPVLECDDSEKFKDVKYSNVIHVKIYYKDCYMYNLPENNPYIIEENKLIYYSIKNQYLVVLFFMIIVFLNELYRYKYNRGSYIKKLYDKFKH